MLRRLSGIGEIAPIVSLNCFANSSVENVHDPDDAPDCDHMLDFDYTLWSVLTFIKYCLYGLFSAILKNLLIDEDGNRVATLALNRAESLPLNDIDLGPVEFAVDTVNKFFSHFYVS